MISFYTCAGFTPHLPPLPHSTRCSSYPELLASCHHTLLFCQCYQHIVGTLLQCIERMDKYFFSLWNTCPHFQESWSYQTSSMSLKTYLFQEIFPNALSWKRSPLSLNSHNTFSVSLSCHLSLPFVTETYLLYPPI